MCCAGRPLLAVVEDFEISNPLTSGRSHTPNFNQLAVFQGLAIFERLWKKKLKAKGPNFGTLAACERFY